MVRRLYLLVALATCFACSGTLPQDARVARAQDADPPTPTYLTICTFNVYRFGNLAEKYTALEEEHEAVPDGIPERVTNCARVLGTRKFDLIVLQEVTSGPAGEAAVADLAAELKRLHGTAYQHFISEYIGRGLMPEAVGFLYDATVVQPELLPGTTGLVENIEIDGRDLVRTQWEAGDFDFTVIAAHLAWGNEDDREAGYEKLNEILHTGTPNAFSQDPDVIVLGDFNRFGGGQDAVKKLSYDPTIWRVPNIEIFDPKFNEHKAVTAARLSATGVTDVPAQHVSTTVAGNTYVYDMIMFTADSQEEYAATTGTGTYGTDFGVVVFDEDDSDAYQDGAKDLSHNVLKEAYSDHRPLWARFRTNGGNADDGPGGTSLTPVSLATKYVATEHGKKFHRLNCRWVRNREIAREWAARDEAAAALTPCGTCRP